MQSQQKLLASVASLVLALSLHLAVPSLPRAEAADCGANDGQVCWQNQSCINILFYKQCTTTYKYYPKNQESEKVQPT